MHKEEVVLLHMTLFQIKCLLEKAGFYSQHFKAYEELGVGPEHVHRSKSDHKKAIFLLCKGISEVFNTRQPRELVEDERVRELILSIAH